MTVTGMAEYIERRAAHDAVVDAIWHGKRSMYSVAGAINSVPTADVAPVRHGRWVMRGGKRYCSECGNRACVTRDSDDFWYTVGTYFCPNCGAKMDLEV